MRSTFLQSILPLTSRTVIDLIQAYEVAKSHAANKDWRSAGQAVFAVVSDERYNKLVYRRLNNKQSNWRAAQILRWNKLFFKAIAEPKKIIWVPPGIIVHKLMRRNIYLNDIMPGNWDLIRGLPELSLKHRAIRQHFQDGVAWEETELFKDGYSRRIARGGSVRGAKTLEELKVYYETYIEALF